MKFDVIAFDADDTLWQSESFYQEAQEAWVTLVSGYGVERETLLSTLHRLDVANLPAFGFGIKGFLLSMIEAAIAATEGRIHAADIQAIIKLGRAMTAHEMRLLPGAQEAVSRLSQDHALMLITKGDLMDQERKIAASGLAPFFHHVEIVKEKNEEVYSRLLRRHGTDPGRFLMIGNAMRSDILPVLALGGWAIYVPHPLTWAHEAAAHPEAAQRFAEIASLDLLPGLVESIEQGDGWPAE